METKLKKLLPLAALCLLSSLDAAQGDSQPRGPAGKINDYHEGRFREITPNAGPRVSDGVDVFITADFIYWTSREDGLGFAYSGGRSGTANVDPGKGDVKHPDFEFNPGFKVGLGLNLSHDGWDVWAQYTWLHSHTDTERTSQELATSTLRPMWFLNTLDNNGTGSTGPSTVLTRATGDWDLHFNVIDLELGRNFFVSQYLTIRPFVGFKGSWQDQDYTVKYEVTTDETNVLKMRMRQDHDWWGVGLRTGFYTAWHFTRRWSIFGNVAIAALWGQYDVDRTDRASNINTNDGAEIVTLRTENDFHSIKPVLELILGLRWETWFSDDDYHFQIQAGWEEQVWFSMNQMFSKFEECAHGDMTFQGFTLQLRFDF